MLAKYGIRRKHERKADLGTSKDLTSGLPSKAEDHHDFPLLTWITWRHHRLQSAGEKADELRNSTAALRLTEHAARCPRGAIWKAITSYLEHCERYCEGKKSAEESGVLFGKNVEDDMAGKYPLIHRA